MLKISVLIITRNRDKDLDECMKSISNQSASPFEVVVVDNDSKDSTHAVCKKYNKILPVKYFQEERIGIPYARNKSIRKAKGDILAFLDDDCISSKTWIQNIKKRFHEDRKLDALAGLSKSYWQKSAPLVEQVYYERWILSITGSLSKKILMEKNLFFDFKNCAIKKNVITKMPKLFSTNGPFGDVGDEDTELVQRLSPFCKKAIFDPKVYVLHKNSQSIKRLITRNFYHGISQHLLFSKKGNYKKQAVKKPVLRIFFTLVRKNIKLINNFSGRVSFLSFLLLYPLFYKTGRLYTAIYIKLKGKYTMPSR